MNILKYLGLVFQIIAEVDVIKGEPVGIESPIPVIKTRLFGRRGRLASTWTWDE